MDCPPQPNSRMSVSALIYYHKTCFKIQLGGIQEHVLFRTLERQITAVRHRKSTGGPKTNTLPIRKKSVRRPPTQTGYPRLPVRVGTRTATRAVFIIQIAHPKNIISKEVSGQTKIWERVKDTALSPSSASKVVDTVGAYPATVRLPSSILT